MSKKNRWYVVVNGRKPGIYTYWDGTGGANEQIQGFPKAKYKGFVTSQEAVQWLIQINETNFLTTHGSVLGVKDASSIESSNLVSIANSPQESENAVNSEIIDSLLKDGRVVIFTDGAALNNPGRGGYGVVLLYKSHYKELMGGYRTTTNNRMELMGCIVALEALKLPSKVTLFSDSEYVIKPLSDGRAAKWRTHGWYRTPLEKAKNSDLWERLLTACEKHEIEFRWVKGHAGQKENERCDELSVIAANEKNLPIDTGYEEMTEPPSTLF